MIRKNKMDESNKNITDEELSKIRNEVLSWIEKNENKTAGRVTQKKYEKTDAEYGKKYIPEILHKKKFKFLSYFQKPKKIVNKISEPKKNKKTKKVTQTKRIFLLSQGTGQKLLSRYTKTKEKVKSLKKPKEKNDASVKIQTKAKTLKFVYVEVLIVGIIFSFITLILTLGVYILPVQSMYPKAVSKFIPFPAAIIGTQVVTVDEYIKNLDAFKETGSQDDVLNRLIDNKVLYMAAKRRGVVVYQSEVDAEFGRLARDFGDPKMYEKSIYSQYGWTKNEFLKYKILPAILRKKIEKKWDTNSQEFEFKIIRFFK